MPDGFVSLGRGSHVAEDLDIVCLLHQPSAIQWAQDREAESVRLSSDPDDQIFALNRCE